MRSAVVSLSLVLVCTACAKSPVSPAGSTTVTAPFQTAPANGAQIANNSQPVTLTISNALVTRADAAVSYTFEVATDAAFTAKVATKTASVDPSGRTSVLLDTLPAGKEYFWHARTTGDDTVGAFSSASRFTIGPSLILQPPVPVSPLGGVTTEQRPTLTVTNAARNVPAAGLSYRFEIAATSAFSPVLVTATVPEGGGSTTSFTPASPLAETTNFVWRALAIDGSGNVTSSFSAAQTFRTTITIDLTTVNYQRFVNVSSWPETDRIIAVDQDGGAIDGYMCIDHTRRNSWPEAPFLGDPTVTVSANQWNLARINGQWYAGAGEWLRPNQICKTGQRSESIGPDGTWGGPMDTWRPRAGDMVGYMITTPARAWPTGRTIDERSNVVVQPWVDTRPGGAAPLRRR